MNVTRTNLANGKYRYRLDGNVWIKSSSVLCTHASRFRYDHGNGNAGFLHFLHESEAAARSQRAPVGVLDRTIVEIEELEYRYSIELSAPRWSAAPLDELSIGGGWSQR